MKQTAMSILAGLSIGAAACPAQAQVDETLFRITTGIEYTSGDYGGSGDIEETYLPVTASLDRGRLGFRLTVPYLSVSAAEGTIITGPMGQPLPGTGERVTESGLGDVIGSVTLYDVVSDPGAGFALDLTGKIKFGTADRDKGLGSGENDYSLQADAYKFLGRLTLIGSAGYKRRGDPAGLDLDDTLFGSVGAIAGLTADTRAGLMYAHRESSLSSRDSAGEVSAFLAHALDDDWQLQLYVLAGASDSSPDAGGGLLLKREF